MTPSIGLLWIITAATSHLAPQWQLAALPPGVRAAGYLIAAAAGATVACCLLSVAITGRLTRWLPSRPGRAPAAAAAAGLSAIWANGLGLVLLAVQLAIAPGRLSPIPAAAAAVASIIRIALSHRAARRCLAIRTLLT